jgi:glycosyltransferase involved in cell wall biosynthesis
MLNHNVRDRSTYFRALGFARVLSRWGHDTTIVTISKRRLLTARHELVSGVRVVETPDIAPGRARSGWDPWDTVYRSVMLLAGGPYDLVHGFDCRPVVLVPSLLLRYFRSLPYVSDWADWWGRGGAIEERSSRLLRFMVGGVETYLEESFRRYADAVTVTSRALAERAKGLGIASEVIHYVPSGADVERTTPLPREVSRRELGLPAGAPIVCFSGFVHYDLELVVRAFVVLRGRIPDALLLLVGPRSRLLRRLDLPRQVKDGIIEVGTQPPERIPVYLSSADVLLLPFGNRPCNVGRGPIKLGEYLAAGRPVVTNPVGEMVPLFERHAAGLLADETPESFAAAIARLLEDRALAEAMGANARQVAEDHLAWDVVTRDLARCYQLVLARTSPGGVARSLAPPRKASRESRYAAVGAVSGPEADLSEPTPRTVPRQGDEP